MSKKVVVSGQVVLKKGSGVEIRKYDETFYLSDEVKSLPQARSVIQAGMITERLRDKMDNFKHVRTCQVDSFEGVKEEAESNSEIDALLIQATDLGCVPDTLELYKQPEAKADVIKNAIKNALKRKSKSKKEDDLEVID